MTSWRLGVIGSPIAHSVSPYLHLAGLKYLGYEGTSVRLDVDQEHAYRIREVMGAQFDALSLTMPLKAVAATMCDELDDRAAALGVVNSLLWRRGKLLGASTDGPGFIDSLRGELGVGVANMHVVVIGSGGAARAIVDSLVREGAGSVTVLGRNPLSVRLLVDTYPRVVDHSLIYRPIDLIVNTTPSSARDDQSAVMQGVSRDTIAIDITYEPRESSWLALHGHLGCTHSNGLAMLAYTVARQMNWWWNSDIPGSYLLPTLVEALK
jgi:shikimate dehydrogenase